MKFASRVIAGIFTLSLSGCATTSSGILSIGKDSFTVTVQSDTATSAKEKAINEANAYCSGKGQQIEVEKTLSSSDALGWHSYEVNFKCVR